MIRRIAFISGLLLGSGLCAWALGSALIYLFTGKLPAIQIGGRKRLAVELIDPHVLYQVRPLTEEAR